MTQPTEEEINVLDLVFAVPHWSDEEWNEYIKYNQSGNGNHLFFKIDDDTIQIYEKAN